MDSYNIQSYTLNCDKCGIPYQCTEGFPDPQVCDNCKPDQSRLLTDEETKRAIWEAMYQSTPYERFNIHIRTEDKAIAKAQLAKCEANDEARIAVLVEKQIFELGKVALKACEARIEALIKNDVHDRLTFLDDEPHSKDGRSVVDEVVLSNATVHLECLSDQHFMLIVENDKHRWHLTICAGSSRSKIYAVVQETEDKANPTSEVEE